jgi:hypothetical protein
MDAVDQCSLSRIPAIAGRGWLGFSSGYKFVPKEILRRFLRIWILYLIT